MSRSEEDGRGAEQKENRKRRVEQKGGRERKMGKKVLARKFIQSNVVVAVGGNLMHQLPLLPLAAFDTNCRCSHFRHFI